MYQSLYEYFGKSVGGELGRQVYRASKKDRIKVQTKEVSNPKYRGKVMVYPVDWLNIYFRRSIINETRYITNPCAEISLPEKKKQTLNFY